MVNSTLSARTLQYVAAIANRMLEHAGELILEVNTAVAQGAPALADDPAIVDDTVASNRLTILHFLHVVAVHPDRPVPVHLPAEAVDKARNLVRRGIDLDVVVQAYRFGQEVLLRRWMAVASEVVDDPAELVPVLTAGADLLFAYLNDALALELSQIEHERDELNTGGLTRRAETVRLLLDSAPIETSVASQRLRYPLDAWHTFLALWLTDRDRGEQSLERAAAAMAGRLGVRWMAHKAGVGQLWVWFGSPGPLPHAKLRAAFLETTVNVNALAGPAGHGPAGFRDSHDEAVGLQRFVMPGTAQGALTFHDELGPVAVACQDEARARRFVAQALGRLAEDGRALDPLRTTLRVYLEEGENAPRAAERLNTHRNTVLQRVSRAEGLLGKPVDGHRLAVFLALEMVHRVGPHLLVQPHG